MSRLRAGGGGRLRWSWALLVVVLAAAAGFVWADLAVREAPHLGYLPAGADWVVATDDLPGVWRGLMATEVYQNLTEEAGSPFEPVQRRVRKESGMRPTPSRWALWIGNTFAAGAVSGEHVFVVHPGILPRLAEPVLRTVRGYTQDGGIIDAGDGYYAWRDGFCIASESRTLVEACLRSDAVVVKQDDTERTLRWRGTLGEAPLEAALTAGDNLPLEIRIGNGAQHDRLPETFPGGPWPGETARVQGLPLALLRQTVADLAAEYTSARTQQQVEEILALLPQEAPYSAVVLAGIETADARVLVEPQLFMLAEPVDNVQPPDDAIPVYWNGIPGWMRPWWGQSFTLCFASDDSRAYFAGNQAVMDAFLGPARARVDGPPGLLYLDWQRAAEVAEHLIRQAAAYELLPHRNPRDADRLLPYARAAAGFGEMLLAGGYEDGALVLRGTLMSKSTGPEEAE